MKVEETLRKKTRRHSDSSTRNGVMPSHVGSEALTDDAVKASKLTSSNSALQQSAQAGLR